ncbi:MAG TPA: hypothetical protein VFM94_03590 [Solirubrobacterales bacterium]|nr:hypothetical protein [Solirubrobacterales bacterium]
MNEFAAALTLCFAPIAWWLAGLVVQGAKPRSARLFFHRPLLGRWSASSVKRLRTLAVHGPDSVLSRTSTSITRPTCLLFGAAWLPFSDVSSGPDVQAFKAGAEVATFVLISAIGVVVVVGLVRWALNR